jgi:ketosteroid isomerase-like protein
MTAKAEIAQLLDRWTAAVRALDLDGATRDRSPDIIMFDVPQPLQARGIDAYRDTWLQYFAYEGARRFALEETNIVAGDDVAWVSAILRCTMADHPEGRLTIGLRRVNGQWMVEHEHHSFPMAVTS